MWAVAVLLLAACTHPGPGPGPTPSTHPTPSPSSSARADAWRACGATETPPPSLDHIPVAPTTEIRAFTPISQSDAARAALAFTRTYNYGVWAIEHDQLGVLQGPCIAVRGSTAESDDVAGLKNAQAAGGRVKFDPPAHFVRIGVKAVPDRIASQTLATIGARPTVAVIVVSQGAQIWLVDTAGRHVRQLAGTQPGETVVQVNLGMVRTDGVGLRLVQVADYRCTDPEVAGVCDGVS